MTDSQHPYLLLFYILLTFLLHVVCNYSARQSEKECSSASGGRHGSSSAMSYRTKSLSHLNDSDQGLSHKRHSAKKSKASAPCEDLGPMSSRSKSLLTERDIKIWRVTVARYANDVYDVDRTVPTHRRRRFQPNRFSPFAYSSDSEDQPNVHSPPTPSPPQSLRFCTQRNKFTTSFDPSRASISEDAPAVVPTSPSISEREKWRRWNKVIDEVEQARREGKLEEYAAKRRGKTMTDEPSQRSQETPTDAHSSVKETRPEDISASGTINTELKQPQTTCEVLSFVSSPFGSAAAQEAEVQARIDRLEQEKEELALQIEAALLEDEGEEQPSHVSAIKAEIQPGCADAVVTDTVTGPKLAPLPAESESMHSRSQSEDKKGEHLEEEKNMLSSPTTDRPLSEQAGADLAPQNEHTDEWQAILDEEVSSHFGSPFDEPSELPEVANATPEPAPWPVDPPAAPSGNANSATDGPPQEANGSDKTDALAPKRPQEIQSPGERAQEEQEQPHSEHGGTASALENNQVEEAYDVFNDEVPSNFGSLFDEPSELPVITTGPEPAHWPVDPPSAPTGSENLVTGLLPQKVNGNDKTDVPDPKDLQETSNSSTDQGKQVNMQSSSVDVDELAKAIEDELAASDDSDVEEVTTPPGPPGVAHVVIAEQAPATDKESTRVITCVEEDVNMDLTLETSSDSRMEQDELKAPTESEDDLEKLKVNQDVIAQNPYELSVPEVDEDMVDVLLLDQLDLGNQPIDTSMTMDDILNGAPPAFTISEPEQDDAMPLADMPGASLDTVGTAVPMTEAVEPVQQSLESETQRQLHCPSYVEAPIASSLNAVPSIEPVPPIVEKDIPVIIAPPTELPSVAAPESAREIGSEALIQNHPQSLGEEPTPSVAAASSDLLVSTVVPSVAPAQSADKAVAPGPVASSSAPPSTPSLQVPNRAPAANGSSSTPSSSASLDSAASASTPAPVTTMESTRSQISMEPLVPRVVRTRGGKAIAGKRPTQLAGPSTSTTPSQEAAAVIPSASSGLSAADKGKENAHSDPSVPPVADADIGDDLKKLLLAADTYSKTLQASQEDPSVMFLNGNGLASRAEASPSLQVILDELDRIKAMAAPDEKSNGDKNDADSTSTQDTMPRSGDTVLDPSGASIQIHPRLTSENIRCWYPMMMDENELYEDRMAAAAMLSGDDAF